MTIREWTIKVSIDCGGDDETENVMDDLVFEGYKTIRDGMEALNIESPTNYVTCTDPNGKGMC